MENQENSIPGDEEWRQANNSTGLFLPVALERRLVQSARHDRNIEAFQALYRYYAGPIYRYLAFRLLNRREEAEELTARIFIEAWECLNEYDQQAKKFNISFLAWLYNLARHWSSPQYYYSADATRPDTNYSSVLEEFAGQPDEMQRAVLALPAEQQFLIYLYYFEGLQEEELVYLTGYSPEKIRKTLDTVCHLLEG